MDVQVSGGGRVKARDLARALLDAGGVIDKRDGDHHWFRLPDGQRVCLPMGGGHSNSSPGIERKVKRALQQLSRSKDPSKVA